MTDQKTQETGVSIFTPEAVLKIKTLPKMLEFIKPENGQDNVQALLDYIRKQATSTVSDVTTSAGYRQIGTDAADVSRSKKAVSEAIARHEATLKVDLAVLKSARVRFEEGCAAIRADVLAPRNKYDEEQKEIERKRVAEITGRIEEWKAKAEMTGEEGVEEIQRLITNLDDWEIDDSYQELQGAAHQAKAECNKALVEALDTAHQIRRQQESEAKAKEAAKGQAQAEAFGRLMGLPYEMQSQGASSERYKEKIAELEGFTATEEKFGAFATQINAALPGIIAQLRGAMPKEDEEAEQNPKGLATSHSQAAYHQEEAGEDSAVEDEPADPVIALAEWLSEYGFDDATEVAADLVCAIGNGEIDGLAIA